MATYIVHSHWKVDSRCKTNQKAESNVSPSIGDIFVVPWLKKGQSKVLSVRSLISSLLSLDIRDIGKPPNRTGNIQLKMSIDLFLLDG